jgi:2-polyprenyl-6-methoxyphenol hydroxylase-like FAD-dependent oxidoreductase
VNAAHKTVLDLQYARVGDGVFGLGLHRGVLFNALHSSVVERKVQLRFGVEVRGLREERPGSVFVVDAEGRTFGPHQLVVVADGAGSLIRSAVNPPHRIRRYPWGALWFVGRDTAGTFSSRLHQVVDGTSRLLGFLPTGLGPDAASSDPLVSLFWSIRHDQVDRWREHGFGGWKEAILRYEPRAWSLLQQIESPAAVLHSAYHDVTMLRCNTGSVLFIGDAAHAMSPQLGQGCNLGLFDAMVLGDLIGELGGKSDPARVQGTLARFDSRRKAHIRFYQLATRWLTPFFQSDLHWLGPLRDALMGVMSRLPVMEEAMLLSMVGVKRGVLRRSMPLTPMTEALCSATRPRPEIGATAS